MGNLLVTCEQFKKAYGIAGTDRDDEITFALTAAESTIAGYLGVDTLAYKERNRECRYLTNNMSIYPINYPIRETFVCTNETIASVVIQNTGNNGVIQEAFVLVSHVLGKSTLQLSTVENNEVTNHVFELTPSKFVIELISEIDTEASADGWVAIQDPFSPVSTSRTVELLPTPGAMHIVPGQFITLYVPDKRYNCIDRIFRNGIIVPIRHSAHPVYYIEYSSGFKGATDTDQGDLPADLLHVIMKLANDVMMTSQSRSGLQSETIGDYSYTLGSSSAGADGSRGRGLGILSADMVAILRRYKREGL